MKILHIAPFNTAGVPFTLVKAERKLKHYSRLITLGKDARNYEEDVCLELPYLNFWGTRFAKRLFSNPNKLSIDNRIKSPDEIPLTWRPNGRAEKMLIKFREARWQKIISGLFEKIDFWNFDVYQLDGGLEFFRDGRTVQRLKQANKKIICCYTGSDLRTRGVMTVIDACSDLNVTLEFDHLRLHHEIHHVLFPFDTSGFKLRPEPDGEIIKIGHAPTNRQAKGSDTIITAIQSLQKRYSVELLLIENLPHRMAIQKKAQCHIFVDQLGELGYGVNSLESLAMGIATCSCLASGFEKRYPDHPFVVIDENNIEQKLRDLIENPDLRKAKGRAGRDWVKKYHDSVAVARQIHALAGLATGNP
ncbi:MAG: glycosyltransferase [bacterium]